MLAKIQKYQDKFEGIDTNFADFAENRSSSISVQFSSIFKRNALYLVRNPNTIKSIFFQGIFIGLLVLAMYYKFAEFSNVNMQDPSSF